MSVARQKPSSNAASKRKATQEEDYAAEALLELLKRLRRTFLQDIVHWRLSMPNLYIWENALFATDEYRSFESAALQESAIREQTFDDRLALAMPLLTERLTAYHSQ